MPDGFKNLPGRTDAAGMSDTATNGSLDAFLLDGDAPRLGSATPMVPPPAVLDHEVRMAPPAAGALPAPGLGSEPVLLGPAGPSLPNPVPAAPAPVVDTDQPGEPVDDEPRHPMAHLMPVKNKPNESSVWAAELRAKKKAKARRNKIIAGVVALAVTAAVGPPLGAWLVDAINESGSTKPDEPAATVPATVPVTSAPAAAATVPPTSAPAGILGLPAQAQEVVAEVNAPDTAATAPAPTPTTSAAPAPAP